jgi:hypothetical protein
MHCDRRDIIRWNKAKKLKKRSAAADAARKNNSKLKLKSKKIDENKPSILRVIKKDGTVLLIEKKLSL